MAVSINSEVTVICLKERERKRGERGERERREEKGGEREEREEREEGGEGGGLRKGERGRGWEGGKRPSFGGGFGRGGQIGGLKSFLHVLTFFSFL